MSDSSPTLNEVINRALDVFSAGLMVCRPGKIEKIDTATGLVDVKPLLKEFTENEQGEQVIESLPVVNGCVLFLPGGGQFVDTFPVKKGDACWVVFADRSLGRWQGTGEDTDPVFLNRHDLSGGLCFVGGRPKAAALSEFDADRRVIGKQGGPRAAFSDSAIHLGVDHAESATEAAVLGTTYTNDEASTFTSIASKLTAAGTALTSAQALITTAASANAVPYTGGASAAGPFAAAATLLGQAGTQLTQAATDLTTFAGQQSTRLSQKVKVK